MAMKIVRRVSTAALTGLAALTLIAAPAAGPASADSPGSYTDSGQGLGNTKKPGTKGPDGRFKCVGDFLKWTPGGPVKAYDNPYPHCAPGGGNNWGRTGKATLCPTGFQVFRFYGTYRNPTAGGYTVSDLNLRNWCKPEKKDYAFWGVTPVDSRNTVPGDPWFDTKGIARNPLGQYAARGRADLVGDTEFGLLSPGLTYGKSGNCKTTMTNNPIAEFLRDPEVTTKSKANVKEMLWQNYRSISQNGKRPKTAAAAIGVDYINKVDGKITMRWSAKACASPMQYVSTGDRDKLAAASEQSKMKVLGTCYIPLDRIGYELRNKQTGATTMGYPSVNGPYKAGERYSDFYAGTTHTKGKERGATGGAMNRFERNTMAKWRTAMGDWYAKQAFYNSKREQMLPAAPYETVNGGRTPVATAQSVDRQGAKWTLQRDSRCRFDSQITFSTNQKSNPGQPKAGLTLEVGTKEMFQAGGIGRVQKVHIRHAGIECTSDKACDDADVTLSELKYDLHVSSTDGKAYTECKGSTNVGCDFRVVSKTKRNTGVQADSTISLAFFTPTMNPTKVRVGVQNVSAKYTWRADTGSISMKIRNPVTGAIISSGTAGGSQAYSDDLPFTVVGEPGKVTKSGARYTFQAPVVGAVSRVSD